MAMQRGRAPIRCVRAARNAAPQRGTRLWIALLAALSASHAGAAAAIDVTYDLGVSLLHTDNIAFGNTNREQETVLSPQVDFEATQKGSTVQLDARGSVQYLDYFRNTFPSEFRSEFSGSLNWTVSPERMDFVVKDFLSRQPVSELINFNPGNQQQVNVFVAGPSMYARFNETTRGQLDLRFSNSHAEETKRFNGDRYNVAARVLHQLSPTSDVSGNVEATQARFDNAGGVSDYTRYDAYVGHTRALAAGNVDVAIGYSQLRLDRNGTHTSSPLVRANLDWAVTPSSSIIIEIRRQLSDVADDLVGHAGVLSSPTIRHLSDPGMLVGPDVFRQRRIEVGYKYSGPRLTLQLRPYYQGISYIEGPTSDQSSMGGSLQLDYRLRPLMTLSFLTWFENHEFKDLSRKDTDFTTNLALTDQVTRHWSWRVELQHRNRHSSVAGQQFGENAANFALIYRR